MKKFITILCFVLVTGYASVAQLKVGLPAGAPAASAILDASNIGGSTAKGFLAPQVALTAINAAAPVTSPAAGLWVYNTATAGVAPNDVTPGYYYWNGTQWMKVNTSSATGNDKNIYEGNGTLTGARTVTQAGNSLGFTGGNISFMPLNIGDAISINSGHFGGNPRFFSNDTVELQSSNNAFQFNLLPSGNIGVGTNAPTTKLDINGTARIRTVSSAASAVTTTPLVTDVDGNVLKAVGTINTTSVWTPTINYGSAFADFTFPSQGLYEIDISRFNGCGQNSFAKFIASVSSANNSYHLTNILATNNLGTVITPTRGTVGGVGNTSLDYAFSSTGCGDGSTGKTIDFAAALQNTAAAVRVLRITNTTTGTGSGVFSITIRKIGQ